jgi:polyhydroxyalkanoate synthesis regulator phasin
MKLTQASFTQRALMVGLIAGSGILAASAFATTAGAPAGKERCEARHAQKADGTWEAKHAARMSELKQKLALNAGQEAAWSQFAGAGQPGARMGGDRQAMRGEFEKLNTPQRLDMMMAMSDARRARMAERSEAVKAFYAQLTPEQQAVFDAEARMGRHHKGHGHHHS